jgi:alanyl-tRNA synthetase
MMLLGSDNDHYREHYAAYNAIADHSRAIAFLIAEGIRSGNSGRDYVLRRIIRRADYIGRTLGFERPFLAEVAEVVIETMGTRYPELRSQRENIRDWTTAEEQRFHRTLASGLRHLEVALGQMARQGATMLPGSEAFKLHDTYGFPLDLTQKILSERGLTVNIEQYEKERHAQQQRSRMASSFKHNVSS